MLALKVAIAVDSYLGGVLSKAANAIIQLSSSSHEMVLFPSVLLACFVHNLYKPSDRRINNGDHQQLYINIWHSGDM